MFALKREARHIVYRREFLAALVTPVLLISTETLSEPKLATARSSLPRRDRFGVLRQGFVRFLEESGMARSALWRAKLRADRRAKM